LKKVFKFVCFLGVLLALLIGTFYFAVLFGAFGSLPKTEDFKRLKQAEATQILDYKGKLVGKIYQYDRQKINYTKLPSHLIDALLATEDIRFFEHNGVDNESLLRVLFKTLILGNSSAGGGSTITQQLIKNTYGRKDYGFLTTATVKTKEIILAKRIEKTLSKEEILELYLNTVPFSGNTYGIESASQKFFNKSASLLQLHESATLIGTLKANHSYNPKLFPERSKLRRDVVLTQLQKYEFIDQKTLEENLQKELDLDLRQYNDRSFAKYFLKEVEKQTTELLAQKELSNYDLKTDGLIIHTTLDAKLQAYVEDAMTSHLKQLQNTFENQYANSQPWKNKKFLNQQIVKTHQYKKIKSLGLDEKNIEDSLNAISNRVIFDWEGARSEQISVVDSLAHQLKFLTTAQLAIHPQTGEVRAYVGGINQQFFPQDNVKKAKRQIGSTFKPILYAAALENGFSPCDYISNKPITYTDLDDWSPKNASNEDTDASTNFALKEALAKSMNTISVRLIEEIGISKTIEIAKSMGLDEDMPSSPSLALGVLETTVFELAKVYTSIADENRVKDVVLITKIENQNGETIYKKPETSFKKSKLSEKSRIQLIELMKGVTQHGTASRLKSTYGLNYDIASKTGTTQKNRDGWFVGVMPELVYISWVGHPYEFGFTSTAVGQGANSALPVFAKTLQKMSNDQEYTQLLNQSFPPISKEIQDEFDCPPEKKGSWLKRVFSKDEEEREFNNEEKKKKKKGLFSIFKKKD